MINLSLHRIASMRAENEGTTFSSLNVTGDDGVTVALFMPYPVAAAVARAFTEATEALSTNLLTREAAE